MNNDHVIEYCEHRERYLAAQRATMDERAENADAMRTIGGLLTDAMVRNGVKCVRVVRQHEPPSYIRVVPPRRRAKPLKTIEDVEALLTGISKDVIDVPFEELPRAITRAIEERARQQGGSTQSRVQFLKRVGIRETVTELDHTCREVSTLSRQLHDNHTERTILRERMTPLRDEVRRCERTLLPACTPSEAEPAARASAIVQMACPDRPTAAPRTLHVSQREYVKRKNVFGLRNVCQCARTALESISRRDEEFERTLLSRVRDLLEEESQRPPEVALKIAVRRQRNDAPSSSRLSTDMKQ